MDGDATEIKEHSRNHRKYQTKQSKQTQKSSLHILIVLMEILLLMTTQMQMKAGTKQKKMRNCHLMTRKTIIFVINEIYFVLKLFLMTNLSKIIGGSICPKEK